MNSVKTFCSHTFKAYFCFIILFILGGCSSGVNMLPTLSEKNMPKENQGVVVVRVVNASAYPLPFNQVTITPKNLNESKKIKPSRLRALPVATTGSTIFSSPVTSGSYSLDSIRSFHIQGEFWYSRWAPADAQFGTFDVEAGKVTDLGTIIYYPKPEKDKYLNTILRQPSAETANVLANYFSFYPITDEQVLTWTEDEYQEERDALYVSIAQNPVTFNTKYLAPDNTIYFIGKLGVILKRTADKEWHLDAVDTDLDLSTIYKNELGNLIVGGDEGAVFFKSSDDEWHNISTDKSHHVEEVYFNGKGDIEIITREETKVHILAKPFADLNAPWATLATYSSTGEWRDADGEKQTISAPDEKKKSTKTKKRKRPKRIVSATTNRGEQVNTITIKQQSMSQNIAFGSGDVENFAFNPKTWEVSNYESDTDISKTFDAGVVKLGVEFAGFWSLTGKPTYYKKDINTSSWNKIVTSIKSCKKDYKLSGKICVSPDKKTKVKVKNESFSFTSVPWFTSNTDGTAIVSFSDYNFWSGKRSNEIKIVKTNDGGKTWQKTGFELPNKFCTSLISEVKDSMLLSCKGVSADFYESVDQGETWQQVREHENF